MKCIKLLRVNCLIIFMLCLFSCDNQEEHQSSQSKQNVQPSSVSSTSETQSESVDNDEDGEDEIPLPSLPEMNEKEKFEFISEFFKPLSKPQKTSSNIIYPTRFDEYLKGDLKRLNTQEKQGLFKFVVYGCAGCHEGIAVGGNRKEKVGIMANADKRTDGKIYYKIEQTKEDKYVLVSSLRNVIQTPPYFHNNGVSNISDAVQLMAKLQLGFKLSQEDIADIVVFLDTLTYKSN